MARYGPYTLMYWSHNKVSFFCLVPLGLVHQTPVSQCALHHTPSEKEPSSLNQRQIVSHKGDLQCSRHLSDPQPSPLSLSGVPFQRSQHPTMSGAPSTPIQALKAQENTASTATTSNTPSDTAAIRRSVAMANAGPRNTAAWWVGIIVRAAHEHS